MDSKDSKLKFLPRHLQRTQPAASNKSKRRVTVEDDNNCDEESDRRSVFERLGPGGTRDLREKPCFEFLEEGKCKYGKNCMYSHNVKGNKKRDTDKSPDNLRLTFKGVKEKDTKLRSQVVVRKAGGSDDDSEEDSDGWSLDIDKLESKKELELEQKRKELLLSLSVLDEEGSGDLRKTDSSDSESSPDRRNKKKKDKMGKKKDKKKHKKGGDRELSVEKVRDGKRRHDSDDEKSSPHKKRKKKKNDKRPDQDSPSPPTNSHINQTGKHKKSVPVSKSSSKGSDLYNPESPTMDPIKDTSHEEKRSSSSSPSPKNKLKKKKKKGKESQDVGGKSRKLLSPLMKVLKVKKGPESVSSKRSRSRSREPVHKRSRTQSSSSSVSSSASPTPARKKKPASSASREPLRKKSRSLEKRKRTLRTHRGGSSSSSSSSSTSSPSPRKGKKGSTQRLSRPESGNKKDRSVSTGRGRSDVQLGRRKDSRPRDSHDVSSDKKRGKATEDRGRARDRGNRKETQVSPASHRRPVSQTHRETSRDHRDAKAEPARSSDRDRDRERDRDRDSNRGATRAVDHKKDTSSTRDRDKGGDRDKGTDREKDIGRGSRDKGRDNEKGDRDASRGERDLGRKEREKETGRVREKEVGRDRDKEVGRRDREAGKGERDRDTSRGEREVNRSDRERDHLRGEREIGRGEREMGRGEREIGRGDREIGRGERDLGRVERDIGRGGERELSRELGRGEREMGRGERELSRGEVVRGERELSRGEVVRGEREIGRGERDISRGERELGRSDRDIGRDERDLGRGEREMGRERDLVREREIGRGDRDLGRGDIRDRNRRAGSLDRDHDDRLRRDQAEFGGPAPLNGLPLDRLGRFGFDPDRERPFEEPGRFRVGELGPPMGLFHGDMEIPRGAFGRGFIGDPFDRHDMRGFDPRMERGHPMFPTFGGRGRDRSWERGQERGRDGRRFGDFRGDERAREFGSGIRDGREERLLPFPPGGSSDNKGLLSSGDGNRLDDNSREEIRSRDPDREDNWKRRGGSHDSRDQDNNRSRRKEEAISDDRLSHEKGPTEPLMKNKQIEKENINNDSKKEQTETIDKSKLSASTKIKASPVKEESPLTRDEPSLASLFSQTETVGPKKKPPAKSFGGKKSPKTSDDVRKTTDKSKSTINSRMNTRRTTRSTDKKAPISKLGDTTKEDGKVANKADGVKKDKRSPSPKSSQKSSDSSRSTTAQPKSKKSKSPESKTSRSPAPKRNADNSRSVRKVSPVPGPRDKDQKSEDKARSSSPSTSLTNKKEEPAKLTKPDINKDQKTPRSRSGSLSDADAHHKPAVIGDKSATVEKDRRKSSDSESQVKDEEGDIAAAMLSDSIDEKQEEIVFSDWSEDDDADTILLGGDRRKNQVEDLDHDEYENTGRDLRTRRSPAGGGRIYGGRLMDFDKHGLGDILTERPAIEKNIPNVKILEDVQKEKPARERRKRNDDDEGYEEISSDENDLDEEGERISKRTIVSILDIDLEALMPQSKPRTAPGPVFQRYKPAFIFAELGLSKAYAGDALFAHVQDVCQKQLETMTEADHQLKETPSENIEKESSPVQSKIPLKVETDLKQELSISIKQETNMDGDKEIISEQEDIVSCNDVQKRETLSEKIVSPVAKSETLTSLPKPEFKLFGTTSAYHKLLKTRAEQKSALIDNAGLFRRALTARKDLDIRRQLCRIDPKYDQGAVYPSGSGDPQLTRECLQLFRARRPKFLAPLSNKPVKSQG